MADLEHTPSQGEAYYTDPESASEMARLTKQARLLTRAMGGPLDEAIDQVDIIDVLDVACGPGEWALEMAALYPNKQITGVDISQLMIEYARFQASQRSLFNTHFHTMDILQSLDFQADSFDFINVRLIASFMFRSSDNWPRFLQECVRVARPGGIIRLTDCEWFISNSPKTETLFGLCTRAIHLSGNTFSQDGRQLAITPMLKRFLRNAGCRNVQHKAFAVDCSAGSDSHQSFYEDMQVFLKLLQPLVIHTGIASKDEVESLYTQALEEIKMDNFNCLWYYLTTWGENAK
ncbi:class I SAM-dependent methyltransferase [Dictyobacter aurantiacus]|uniref:Methyltransferase domain-containing protein n=1 Tax=Dictyobacter aurantiacus TaxID=1936993 RepID=A0A401Z8W8_9CHLR|nr:class I SAM-dependent methyltransferase [Dictyobacter aurantiacus]GCE03258.1 hypothetical protein KDAU_05870 [Dictyobacter aurantiacus]